MSSRDFGLGPKWWQQPDNKLKKCSERFTEWCDPVETDGCCAIIPCMYCLELEIYGEETQHGDTEFGTMGWVGSVGGGEFFGFWEVGYESGVCEFVVHWNGEEVYRKSCADGQSCRDSSDEVAVVADYEDAVLRWVKHEYRPMPYVKDPDTDCTTHFCGTCECTCRCLCMLLIDADGRRYREEFCDSAYSECLGPVWAGTIGGKEVSLALGRDQYTGNCIVTATVDGIEQDPIEIGDCKTLAGTITLPDYSELSFSCKVCDCPEDIFTIPCCGEIPITEEDLNVRLEGHEAFGPEGQFSSCSWEGAVPLYLVSGPYFRSWAGIIPLSVNGGCFNCCDDVVFFVLITCDGTSDYQLCLSYWYAVNGLYTGIPIEGDGGTGWVPGTGHETEPSTECSPLTEFLPAEELRWASCSPLMFYSAVFATHTWTVSELALP